MTMTGPQSAEQFWRDIGKRVKRLETRPSRPPRPRAGGTAEQPDASAVDVGTSYFDTDNGIPVFSTGVIWVPAYTAPDPLSGATADRPDPTTLVVGTVFFDTTLVKPVWCTGTGWVDATGTAA